MAPRKAVKPTPVVKDSVIKPIMKRKNLKKKNYQSFSIYLYKTLRTVAPEYIRISRKSMPIMNDFVNDMLQRIAVEAGRLAARSKKSTMSTREIQAAVRLIVPGELSTHSNVEAIKAIKQFHESHENDEAAKQ